MNAVIFVFCVALALAPVQGTPVAQWLSGVQAALFTADHKARYLARHEAYEEDVRGRVFYHRIVGNEGQSQTGDLQHTIRRQECRSIPQDAEAHLALTKSGSW